MITHLDPNREVRRQLRKLLGGDVAAGPSPALIAEGEPPGGLTETGRGGCQRRRLCAGADRRVFSTGPIAEPEGFDQGSITRRRATGFPPSSLQPGGIEGRDPECPIGQQFSP